MSLSAFGDKARHPTSAELTAVLETAAPAWDSLIAHVNCTYAPALEQWNFASAKFGWSLRLRKADRVILYLIPQSGRFVAGIVLGSKAVAAARSAGLPTHVLRAIADAPRYAEGTGLRLPVDGEPDLPAVQKLLALKMTLS